MMMSSRFARVPKEAKDGYWSYLKHKIEDDAYRQAVKVVFGEAKSFPSPVQVLEAVPSGVLRAQDEPTVRDPWFQCVKYVLRSSAAGQSYAAQFDRVEDQDDEATPSPFFFPRARIEFVDSIDEVRTDWVDRKDLRVLSHEYAGT